MGFENVNVATYFGKRVLVDCTHTFHTPKGLVPFEKRSRISGVGVLFLRFLYFVQKIKILLPG